jgi:hypothetical protein
MELITMSERAPLYMGLITLSSALATVTVVWAGLVGFGLSALVLESVNRLAR